MTVKVKTTPLFNKIQNLDKKILVLRGGTRSAKSYTTAQAIAHWLLTGDIAGQHDDKGNFDVVRKYKSTLQATIMRDFEEILHEWEMYDEINHHKVERIFRYDGRSVEFVGADDQQKLRGRKRKHLFCDEANELNYKQEFFQLMIRTEGKILLAFNPDDEDVWINTELEQRRVKERGDVEVIVSTYLDNPFLDEQIVKEIEYLKVTDPQYWQIYGLGNYGKITGLIFPEFDVVEEINKDSKFMGYGLDFGYTNDPTALIGVWKFDDETLEIKEFLYEKGLTNQDIADKLDRLGIDKEDQIFADSSEPKSIEEIHRRKYNVKPAKKGADSIVFGIDTIKQYKLRVCRESVNLIKELRHYKWIEDKDGNVLNKPIDDYNHGIDALRYCVTMTLNKTPKVSMAKKRMFVEQMRREMGM